MALLDSDQLMTFIAIHETGSHAGAAQKVNKSQSAISMQMKRLEETVGKPLFQRVGRTNQLTLEGEQLLGYAQRIIGLNERALAALTQPELEGRIRVGAPDDYAEQFLPVILSRFSQTHPRVEVEVVCETSVGLSRRIIADKLDLAIVNKDFLRGGAKGQLFRVEPLHWVTSMRHRAHEEAVLPLAVVPEDCSWRKAAENALDSVGRPWRIAYMSASTLGMNVAVQAGLADWCHAAKCHLPGRPAHPDKGGWLPAIAPGRDRPAAWQENQVPPYQGNGRPYHHQPDQSARFATNELMRSRHGPA